MAASEDIEIGPEHAAELIRDGAQLIDVREADEVAEGHLEGARHIALGELTGQAETIRRDDPVVFYCHSGSRSGMAASAFRQAGYRAYNLTGGIVAWEASGLPLS
jgi:hydroxyacylglutathione hydrolase/adenylyltransferase/sulfurtransferase